MKNNIFLRLNKGTKILFYQNRLVFGYSYKEDKNKSDLDHMFLQFNNQQRN